jgi:hypothetical protein
MFFILVSGDSHFLLAKMGRLPLMPVFVVDIVEKNITSQPCLFGGVGSIHRHLICPTKSALLGLDSSFNGRNKNIGS